MYINVGPEPTIVQCPTCSRQVKTATHHVSTTSTHWWAVCLFCFLCPCFWIPYCTSCCRNTDHYCPDCRGFIGTYRRN